MTDTTIIMTYIVIHDVRQYRVLKCLPDFNGASPTRNMLMICGILTGVIGWLWQQK